VLNGVVLMSTFNQLRDDGLPIDRVVREGAMRRLRPVLMTAAIAALGLVPLLFATGPGSEIQKPLAIVVIGGLVTSTALTLRRGHLCQALWLHLLRGLPRWPLLPRGHVLVGAPQLRARQLLPRRLRRAHSMPYPDCACALRLLGDAPIDSTGTRVLGGNFGLPQPLLLELHKRRRYAEQMLKTCVPNLRQMTKEKRGRSAVLHYTFKGRI